mgnify:CR=1 FL=1
MVSTPEVQSAFPDFVFLFGVDTTSAGVDTCDFFLDFSHGLDLLFGVILTRYFELTLGLISILT